MTRRANIIWLWALCMLILTELQGVRCTFYSSSTDFSGALQKLVYIGDNLYVAGEDYLYKLNSTLEVLDTKQLNAGVVGSQHSITCLGEYNSTRVFICSSYRGHCEIIAADTLRTTSNSSSKIATSNGMEGSVVFVKAPFKSSNGSIKPALWISSSYSPDSIGRGTGRIALSVRDPDDFTESYISPGTVLKPYSSSILRYIENPNLSLVDTLKYVYAFSSPDGYRLYIKNNHGQAYLGGMCNNDQKFNTLTEMPLVCISDGAVNRPFIHAAYVSKAGKLLYDYFKLTQSSLTTSDQFLYAVFGDNAMSSSNSLCVFSVKFLVDKLKEVFHMCNIFGNSRDVIVGPPELLKDQSPNTCSAWKNRNNTLTPCELVKLTGWDRIEGYSPLLYRVNTTISTQIDLPFAVNALQIEIVGVFTVAFMTSPTGKIHKAVFAKTNRRDVYKTEDLTEQITPGTTLLPSITVGNNRIYAISRDRVFSVPVQQCNLASDCTTCTELRDPHCGWCSLSNKCTTMSECPRYEDNGHWVRDGGDSTEHGCIKARIDDTHISVEEGSLKTKLVVNVNQLPTLGLSGESYRCCFFGEGDADKICTTATSARITTGLNQVEKLVLNCITPDHSSIRSMIGERSGQDRIETNLTLNINDDEFARLNLTFFQCSAHTSCTSCARATLAFSCVWCLSTRSCYQSPGTCDGSVVVNSAVMVEDEQTLSGADNCPRIEPRFSYTSPPPPLIYVPSGSKPDLEFYLYNKQDDVTSYSCLLTWDGRDENYPADVRASGSLHFLKCRFADGDTISYTGKESTKEVALNIKLRLLDNTYKYLDNPTNLQIEMYKCKEMKNTCGECLSSVDAKYDCGWCRSSSSVCQVKASCPVDAEFLESNKSSCPDLEIREIVPINGPVQGGTKITIRGVNLGKSYSEIKDGVYILLDDEQQQQQQQGQQKMRRRVNCTVEEAVPHDPFEIVCRTPESTEGVGPVRVDISGSELNVVSNQKFSFRTPKPEGLSSGIGPLSGGSNITILGQYVNIGSDRQVHIQTMSGNRTRCKLVPGENPNELTFTTPAVSKVQKVNIILKLDRFKAEEGIIPLDPDFFYTNDSTIVRISPNKAVLSGGTFVNVYGTLLDIINKPRMYLELEENSALPNRRRSRRALMGSADSNKLTAHCSNVTETRMICTMPKIPEHWLTSANDSTSRIKYGFILDNIASTLNLAGKEGFPYFEIVNDPMFENFGEKMISADGPLQIKGENLLGIGPHEIVMPMLSVEFNEPDTESKDGLSCAVTTVTDQVLYCEIPGLDSTNKYAVNVNYGKLLREQVGVVFLTDTTNTLTVEVIIGIAASAGLIFIIVVVIICVLRRRLRKTDRGMKKLQDKMDNLEMTVAKECKEAFTELQTDMTEMTADIAALHGLPFYEYNEYCMKVLFPVQSEYDHPVMKRLNISVSDKEMVERGLRKFSSLLYNKTFLLTLIRTLEQQRKFTMRDRVEVASLVSVALQPCMEYHTDILKTLLAELIERTIETKKDAKILLRRTESVAEKMLSNWFAFLLQKFLKECAGEPLYLLYRAIKQQVDKGPVDAVTSDAKYSLSEEKLLRHSVESHPITLRFCSPDPHAAQDPQTVKVLNCDTISQAIDKILDTLYRNVPNSSKPSREMLTLEWLKASGERVAMYDEDPAFSKVESDGCKRIVTLQCYKITDNAMVALTSKQHSMDTATKSGLPKFDTSSSNGNYYSSTGEGLSRANSSNNILDTSSTGPKDRLRVLKYHLIKPSEADTHQEGDRNKMVSEIYLTRLLATKGTLQQFVDDLFETIFSISHRGSALPLAIKYMFDFLDDQALLHSIGNPEVIHHWKSNSLPLRFWVNVIKNPDFVFDIHKSNIVDACLSVVAQIFMDSCSLSEHRLGKESPSSKLLYAKDIPKYRKWVERYYSDIKSMPAISDHDMNSALAEESRQHRNEFNNSAALYELYQYVVQYQPEIVGALRDDEFARKDRLAEELVSVSQLLNGNARMC